MNKNSCLNYAIYTGDKKLDTIYLQTILDSYLYILNDRFEWHATRVKASLKSKYCRTSMMPHFKVTEKEEKM